MENSNWRWSKYWYGLSNIPQDGHRAESVIIRKNVYIGGNVTIRYGVEIGESAVIAAGSIVTKDVAPFTVVGGNPAKFLRNVNPS